MSFVLTLIADRTQTSLAEADISAACDAMRQIGLDPGHAHWLTDGEAADIPFGDGDPGQAMAAVRTALSDNPIDALAQREATRRKSLLLADMDSTIVTSETLDELAALAGLKDKIAAITARAMNGELDFEEALTERVGMLKGLNTSALDETYAETELTAGARELVQTMRSHGAHCALVSGGFTYFTGRVAEACGFHEHHSNQLIEADGVLTGEVGRPILGQAAKLENLMRLSAERELTLDSALTVGDGANDLAMLQAAGLGVGFHAKPAVTEKVDHQINHCDLSALLFCQGFDRTAFCD